MSKIKLDIPEKAQQILDAMYQTMEGRLEASPNGICPLDKMCIRDSSYARDG